MKIKKLSNWAVAGTLALVLSLPLSLTGCGSLSYMLAAPDSLGEGTVAHEVDNNMQTGEEYQGISILHGTWEEPCYSSDGVGYFYEERGWVYLHVEGDAPTRGYQHGWLLADSIQRSVDHSATLLAEVHAIDWDYLKVSAEQMWAAKVSEELQAELGGIVNGAADRGATIDYLDLLVLNGLEELQYSWFPTVQDAYYQELSRGIWDLQGSYNNATKIAAQTKAQEEAKEGTGEEQEAAASTEGNAEVEGNIKIQEIYTESKGSTEVASGSFANAAALRRGAVEANDRYSKQASALLATGAMTADGGIILAHNTIAAFADSNFFNVMIDVYPSDGQRFTMQAAPGYIHSSAEAYSTGCLLIANTLIEGVSGYNKEGTPGFLSIRQAAQYATTLNEFTQTMVNNVSGGMASSWLVGELETGQIMELEVGLTFYNEQKTDSGCFLSFNGVEDVRILNFETNDGGAADIRTSVDSRHVRLLEFAKIYQGKLTPDLAQLVISDHYDAYLGIVQGSSRSICAHYETDNAEHTIDASAIPYMPFGAVDGKVMSTDLARENRVLARWGCACGRAFDATAFVQRNPQYAYLEVFLFDRPSQFWDELYPLDKGEQA